MNQFFGGTGNVPGQVQFLSQDIRGSSGQKAQRDAVAVLRLGKTIHNLVQCSVATARDDQLPPLDGSALGHFGGLAGAAGFHKFSVNASGRQDSAGFVEHATSSAAAIPGVRVVDQQCVS